MSVLQKNNLVLSAGQRYGVVYSVHPYLEFHFEVFQQVCGELGYSMLEFSKVITRTEPPLQKVQKKAESITTQTGLASGALPL